MAEKQVAETSAKQPDPVANTVAAGAGAQGVGVAKVKALFGKGIPAAQEVAKVVRANPTERDAIMAFLQTTAGNSYTQLVVTDIAQQAEADKTPTDPDNVPTDQRVLADQFLTVFADILPMFPTLPKQPEHAPVKTPITTDWDNFMDANKQKTHWIGEVAVQLGILFSPGQRKLLASYCATKIIPEGLFTNSAIATGAVMKSTQQRTMMAANILANGRKEKGDEKADSAEAPGKVKAQNCGQWAEYVFIYAGVNSANGDPGGYEGSVKNVKGALGTSSFGGAANLTAPFGEAKTGVTKEKRKEDDEAGVETLEAGGGLGRKDPLGAPSQSAMFAALSGLKEGDWVWTDNRGDADGHSFIFAGWKQAPAMDGKGARGVALEYSQHANGDTAEARKKKYGDYQWAKDGGGIHGEISLGYPFGPDRKPITQVKRPVDGATEATTEAELLHYDKANAAKQNAKSIAAAGADLGKYHAQMAAAADAAVAAASTVAEGQQQLASAIAKEYGGSATIDNLSGLIALVQRLSPTDAKVTKGSQLEGRKVRGYLDLSFDQDCVLIPGGLAAIKKSLAP